mgnify:CR=1 FL=1
MVGIPAAIAARVSVSNLSPTASGFCASMSLADAVMISGSGLPVEAGRRFVALVTAATRAPLPIAMPSSVGSVESRLVA